MALFNWYRNSWRKWLLRWLDKRIPRARKQALNHQSIFIIPSKFGLLWLITAVLIFLLGTNYQNNLMLLISYFMVSIFLISILQSYVNFVRLRLSADAVKPVFSRTPFSLGLRLENKGSHGALPPINGELELKWFDNITNDLPIMWDVNSTSSVHINQLAHQRGKYTLPRVTLSSYYPLGLFRCWTHLDFAQQYTVYPTPLACPCILSTSEHQQGEAHALRAGGIDEFYALASYQHGQPLNRVAWKQVAKSQQWSSKVFSSPEGDVRYLRFDDYSGDYEQIISKLSYQVISLSEQNMTFALALPHCVIAPDNGDEHRHHCLTVLAEMPRSIPI